MSFLSIAFLFALPVVAFPIALHFFDRRRQVEIPWAAMQFLQSAPTRQSRARRLKEWLLLACRVAALAALVFALARPLAPAGYLNTKIKTDTIIVLDNSMSTQASEVGSGKTQFSQLQSLVQQRLGQCDEVDTVRILTTSPRPTWMTTAPIRASSDAMAELPDRVDALAATSNRSDLVGSLLSAVNAPVDPTFDRREIIVFSDGQATDWNPTPLVNAASPVAAASSGTTPPTNAAAWNSVADSLRDASIATSVEVAGWESSQQRPNVCLSAVEAQPAVVGVDQPVSLTAQITNHNSSPSAPGKLEFARDDKVIQTVALPSLDPQESRSISWQTSIRNVGTHAITSRVQLDGNTQDQLTADNQTSVVIQVVRRIPILVLDSGEGFGESDQDAYFLSAALGRVPGETPASWQSVFDPRVIPPNQLASIDLSEFKVIVIPSLERLSDEATVSLREFVRSGGGLWLAVGPRTDTSWFNDRLYGQGDGLSPVRLDRIVQHTDGDLPVLINPYLGDHRTTRLLSDQEKLDTGDIRITERFRFDNQSITPQLSILLGLTNGQPMVVEQTDGLGRVLVQSLPLRLQWSQLVRSEAFVVMVQTWLSYLAEPGATHSNLIAGQPIRMRWPDATYETATLRSPTGDETDLSGQRDGDTMLFFTSATHSSGIYTLELGLSGTPIPFWVARDPDESNLTPLSSAQRAAIQAILDTPMNAGSERAVPNSGQPLWPWLLMTLVLLIAADIMLSGSISRGRFGVKAIDSDQPAIEPTPLDRTPLSAKPSSMSARQPVRSDPREVIHS